LIKDENLIYNEFDVDCYECKSMSHIDLIASVTAGAVAEVMTLPICTVQTVYQTQKNLGNSGREGIVKMTGDLYRTHGLKAFYNASFSAIACQMVSTGSKFTLYKAIQQYRGNQVGDVWNNVLNGGLAGVMSIAFTQPFDVMKNYHQRQLSILPDLRRNPMVLYAGTKQAVTKSALLVASLFSINDLCRTYIDNAGLAAMTTSLLISPVIHPIDLLKRRAMANERLWLGWNPKHYYRGMVLNWTRSMPHFAISMMTIDYIKRMFD